MHRHQFSGIFIRFCPITLNNNFQFRYQGIAIVKQCTNLHSENWLDIKKYTHIYNVYNRQYTSIKI